MPGNNLTLTSATFDASTQKYGANALSGGYGLASGGPIITTSVYTMEAQVKLAAPPAQLRAALGQTSLGWFGVDTNGHAYTAQGVGAFTPITSSAVITDGNWHHIAVSVDGKTVYLFVDGILAGTSAYSPLSVSYTANPMGVGTFGGSQGATVNWPGEVDEAAFWSIARYTSAFTPPSAAYIGSEAGLLSLFHLDGSGTDSAVATTTTVAPNNAAVSYSPYGWLVGSASAKTINAGQYLRTGFSGANCTLNFDISNNSAPLPQIWYRVDGLYWQVARLAATVALTMPTESTAWPKHTLEVLVKSTSEWVNRWNSPQNASVTLTGITLASGGTLFAPSAPYSQTVMFAGDSITEGYHTINGNNSAAADDVIGSDAMVGWAYMQRQLLGVEVGIIGFGSQGLTQGGLGNVPQFSQAFPYLWSGQPRIISPVPNVVVTNHGGNDRTANTSTFVPAYVAHLNQIMTACPNAKVLSLRPFGGGYTGIQNDIQTAITQCANPGLVTYADCLSAFDTSLSADALHPFGVANIMSIAPAVAAAVRPLLSGASPRFANTFH